MTDIDYAGLREKAEKATYSGGGEQELADAALALLDENERLRSTLLRIHGYVQGVVRREVPTFEDQYGAEYDASLFESLADAALDESTGIPFDADEDRAIVSTWIAEKARERREEVS